ncbi:MAG: hypothetical protein CVT48_03050 [Thermoplasmata archaeon HGW-Thermoplasmata-1]|nr:MAG: hypothetical protein CVT48_03050 [Thermoplasmata archaeon HGW-Thermoplasmata-1]
MKLANKLGRALSSLSLYSASHPHRVIAVIAVFTIVMAGGIFQLETSSDLVKILPRGDPNTNAALNVSRDFSIFYDSVKLHFAIDEGKWEAANAKLPYRMTQGNASDALDEVYVRALEEFCEFMASRSDTKYFINVANLVKTVNWTNSAVPGVSEPDPAAFAMPGTDPAGEVQYFYDWQGLQVDPAYDETVAPDRRCMFTMVMFDMSNMSHLGVGDATYKVIDEYREWAPEHAEFDVFDLEQIAVMGVPATDAYAAKVLGADIALLTPLAILFILVALFLAFRNPAGMMVSILVLIMSFFWTLGLMGYAKIPFSALNLAIVPLILGNGIDYSIHMVGEYIEHREKGMNAAEAFGLTGYRAGLAMFIATLTTVIGLMLMVFSPSVLMAQLGFVSAIAMIVIFLFTLTFVPALLTLTDAARFNRHDKSSWRIFPSVARFVSRRPTLGIVSLVVVTLVLTAFLPGMKMEVFGDPELNYPPGHRVRDDHDWINNVFWKNENGSVVNMIIVEGDATEPILHEYLDRLESNLVNDPDVSATQTASITRVLRGYIAIRTGTAGAIPNIALETLAPGTTYPKTQDEMKEMLDEMFDTPMANYASFLLVPEDYDITVLAFTTQQGDTFEDAERVWNNVWRVIDETNEEYGGVPPVDAKVALFGPTSFSYLFISKEMPWVNYMGIASLIAVGLILLLLTRNLQAVGAVTAVVALSSIWWYGILSIIGIGLSVTMMLPLIFIIALGSDYAVHLIWNMEHSGNREDCYGYVGKAVFFSALTDFGAFIIFANITDMMVQKAMMATAIAILITFIATMIVVPMFYPLRDKVSGQSRAMGLDSEFTEAGQG